MSSFHVQEQKAQNNSGRSPVKYRALGSASRARRAEGGDPAFC